MRLVFMGTGPFAVPTFQSLHQSPHEIVALITRPVPSDRDRQKAPANPMRDAAAEMGVATFAPDSVNSAEAHALLQDCRADLFVVCDYGQILKPATLALAPLGGINLHGSLLPKYRGAAPIHWAIYHGETETGATVIHMTSKLDGGPRLAWRKLPIGPMETTEELEPKLAQLGVEAVHEAIRLLEQWDGIGPIGERQDAGSVSLAPRLKKSDGEIDWNRKATQIVNQVRAFKPWPLTYSFLISPGKQPLRLIFDQVHVGSPEPCPQPAGSVIRCHRNELAVATGQGELVVDRVQPAGKRLMSIEEFQNGYRLRLGDRFGPAT